MIPTSSLADAANQARRLLCEPFFQFVEKPSRFHVRAASRSEVFLLQDFLSGFDNKTTKYHAGSDYDAFLAQRARLLRTFFMMLYLDPVTLRKRVHGVSDAPQDSSSEGSGGSGGISSEIETVTVEPPEQSTQAPQEAVTSSPGDHADVLGKIVNNISSHESDLDDPLGF